MVAPSGNAASTTALSAKKKAIRERVYTQLSTTSVDAWFRRIQGEHLKPNAEQLAYLHDICDRCAVESKEMNVGDTPRNHIAPSEPYRK